MKLGSEAIADSLFSWVDSTGSTQTLDVDVVMQATDERSVKLTDHPVEDGSVITDHVVVQPESLSMTLVVTQTPMHAREGFAVGPLDIVAESRVLSAASHPIQVRPSEFQPGGFLLLSQGLRTVVTEVSNALLGAVGLGSAGSGAPTEVQGSELLASYSQLKPTVLKNSTPVDRVADVHDRLIEILQNALPVTVSFKGRLYIDYLLTRVRLVHESGKAGAGKFEVEARAFHTVSSVNVELPDPADFRAKPKANKGNKPAKVPDPDPSKRAKSWLKRGSETDAAAKLGRLMGL